MTKLYDGTSYYTAAGTITFPFDTWGVEHVEVLKGPSSVLYGEGGIGGAINVIPSKPQRERSGDVRLILGEGDTQFIGIDYTNALGDSAAFRIDYSNSQSDNWVVRTATASRNVCPSPRNGMSATTSCCRPDSTGVNRLRCENFGVPVAQGR